MNVVCFFMCEWLFFCWCLAFYTRVHQLARIYYKRDALHRSHNRQYCHRHSHNALKWFVWWLWVSWTGERANKWVNEWMNYFTLLTNLRCGIEMDTRSDDRVSLHSNWFECPHCIYWLCNGVYKWGALFSIDNCCTSKHFHLRNCVNMTQINIHSLALSSSSMTRIDEKINFNEVWQCVSMTQQSIWSSTHFLTWNHSLSVNIR